MCGGCEEDRSEGGVGGVQCGDDGGFLRSRASSGGDLTHFEVALLGVFTHRLRLGRGYHIAIVIQHSHTAGVGASKCSAGTFCGMGPGLWADKLQDFFFDLVVGNWISES